MTYYHGTAESQLGSILAKGLVPHGGKGGDEFIHENRHLGDTSVIEAFSGRPSVFLTPLPKWAGFFANLSARVNKSKPVVLAVNVPRGTALVPDELDTGSYRYDGVIPPEWIKPLN